MCGRRAGLRCATSVPCLLSGLMSSLNCVHSQVALAQVNMDEETYARTPLWSHIRLLES